uniref:TIGR03435 family protein n=1 Tax=Solibacter usitatus (strain Ellin6076) TaxID=234267 RepID=Q01YQ7_SOLUE
MTAGFIALCLLSLPAFAQQPELRRRFEVASIKPNVSGRRPLQSFAYSPGGGFTAINATLVDVIVRVYPTRRIQMQGGPDWIDSERFDFIAKADASEGKIKPEDWTQMVQVLLEERFRLKFHTETRPMQVLALVQGKVPPRLAAAKDGEETGLTPGELGKMIFTRMSMAGLVNLMSNIMQLPVIDRTGLEGFYDFTLDPNRFADTDNAKLADLIVIAVSEQLGLRLEKQKAPLEITIIDRAEKPTGN